jgi:flagellar basal body-associated protein FliL
MNQNFDVSIEPEAPKKKNNTILIVVIVLVVLCCCCLGVLGLAWAFGDQILQTLSAAGY